jgi:hypothetical protein
VFVDCPIRSLTCSLVFNDWLEASFPYASGQSFFNTVDTTYPSSLYPNNNVSRIAAVISDAIIDCNVLYLSHAFSNATWNYQFAPSFVLVDVGYHGLDLCWTFFPNMIMNFSGSANLCQSRKWDYPTQAHYFQLYLLSFVKYGDPNTGRDPSTPEFKQFGTSKYYIELKGNSFTLLEPDTELPDDRCAFWQPAPYESRTRK